MMSTTALTAGFTACMRPITASVASRLDICPALIAVAVRALSHAQMSLSTLNFSSRLLLRRPHPLVVEASCFKKLPATPVDD
jgi:hypothetical protein